MEAETKGAVMGVALGEVVGEAPEGRGVRVGEGEVEPVTGGVKVGVGVGVGV